MKSKTKGVLSIIFVAVGFIFSAIALISILFCILAICFGLKAKEEGSKKIGVVGVILGITLISLTFISIMIGVLYNYSPRIIMESCSMYHEENFDEWWQNHNAKYSKFNINKQDFQEFSLKRGFSKGDILLAIKANPEKLKVGDVIIFNTNQRNLVNHRIVHIKEINEEKIFSTIADNNPVQLSTERSIKEEQLVGKVISRPFFYRGLGWIKLIFYEQYKPIQSRGLCKSR
ncbi:signal peptidase I [Candidatus Pacearchaeota archaeon]|nr:signal peptidase I [Candidatus Pacearchaeota archaeon]